MKCGIHAQIHNFTSVPNCPSNSKSGGQNARNRTLLHKPATAKEVRIPVVELAQYIGDWQNNCRLRQDSAATVQIRQIILSKFLWFLNHRIYQACGASELRQFFVYLAEGHKEPGGRWGNPRLNQPMRPCSSYTYYKNLSTLFKWLTDEEIIPSSPMNKIPAPKVRSDQIQPFTQEQIIAIMEAAKRSRHRQRDVALVQFLHDTGLRASEVCHLKVEDVDFQNHCCTVLGKGNKYRKVYFGRDTAKSLWQYLRAEKRDHGAPLFLSNRGTQAGAALTRNGLFQLIQRLGVAAGISGVRCSPHTFRHTFAVDMLRNGANTFSLKALLGHESLHITQKYVALTQADIENQHRQCSPVD